VPLDRYSPYLPWFLLFVFFLLGNGLFLLLCDWPATSFHLNSDGPDKAQQLPPYCGYDFLFFLAGCE
jgi:hypothetical protein